MKNPVQLPVEEIDKISKTWGSYKYAIVFRMIANNPGILTHTIAHLAPCNNVPDNAVVINEKLAPTKYRVKCEPTSTKRNATSFRWFVVVEGDDNV